MKYVKKTFYFTDSKAVGSKAVGLMQSVITNPKSKI